MHSEGDRARALLDGENRIRDLVASRAAVSTALLALCRLGDDVISASRCQVLLVDPSGRRFERAIAPSLPTSLVEREVGLVVRPASGPCGWAAAMRTQVMVPDIAKERRWLTERWPAWSLGAGLRACFSTPILSRAQMVLGTFSVYRLESGYPGTPELERTARLAQLAAMVIEGAQPDAPGP